MAFVRKIKGSLVRVDSDDYVGESSYLFYDIETACIRITDGTPGGKPACIEGTAGSVTWGSITGDINNVIPTATCESTDNNVIGVTRGNRYIVQL